MSMKLCQESAKIIIKKIKSLSHNQLLNCTIRLKCMSIKSRIVSCGGAFHGVCVVVVIIILLWFLCVLLLLFLFFCVCVCVVVLILPLLLLLLQCVCVLLFLFFFELCCCSSSCSLMCVLFLFFFLFWGSDGLRVFRLSKNICQHMLLTNYTYFVFQKTVFSIWFIQIMCMSFHTFSVFKIWFCWIMCMSFSKLSVFSNWTCRIICMSFSIFSVFSTWDCRMTRISDFFFFLQQVLTSQSHSCSPQWVNWQSCRVFRVRALNTVHTHKRTR